MSKQRDGLASLTTGSITQRAEVAREYGRTGEPTALVALVDSALGDKSPGVRLAAASAAADVLARHRLGERRRDLPTEQRRAMLTRLRSLDPGRNSGLFQVLGCLGLPEVVRSIARGVRDPRVDVRTGALVGLERLCVSGEINGNDNIAKAIAQLLAQRRLRPDVSIELARLVYRTGLWQLRPDVLAMAQRLEARWQDEVQEVLDKLPSDLEPSMLHGFWAEHGVDCGEHRAKPDPRVWLVIAQDRLLHGRNRLSVHSWSCSGREFSSGVLSDAQPRPARLLRTRYLGVEGVDVLQFGERSFGSVPEEDLPSVVDRLALRPKDLSSMAGCLLDRLEEESFERPAGAYVQAVLSFWAGATELATERLEAITQTAEARPEAWWHFSTLLDATDRPQQAEAAARTYLERAKKRSIFSALARTRLGE